MVVMVVILIRFSYRCFRILVSTASLAPGLVIGLVVALLVGMVIVVDVAFCQARHCGVSWILSGGMRRRRQEDIVVRKSPEDG